MAERALITKASEGKLETPTSRFQKHQQIRSLKFSALQAKLRIGQPDDIYEQEADRVAEQIMRMPDPVLQRRCAKCNEEDKKVLQTKYYPGQAPSNQGQDVPPIVQDVLRSPGQPLDSATRAFFEPRFGHDFSGVRVHTDARAAESARAVNARAFTVGENVVFGAEQYSLSSAEGRELLAHELGHTIQQTGNLYRKSSSDANKDEVETPEILARKMHDALAKWITNKDEVYRILRFPPQIVRAVINYYNDNYNNLTGKGLIEDIRNNFSGDKLETALTLLDNARPEEDIEYKQTPVSSMVVGEPGKLWVGLIVRGKESKEHHPGVMEQHADVVTPDIASGDEKTLGYFGDDSEIKTSGSKPSEKITTAVKAVSGLKGISADLEWFYYNRPWYIDLELAKELDIKSSLILLKVSKKQAETITKYWEDLKNDPGTFHILGHNCSTAAAVGFEKAGITKEISGLDTPDNLFEQLKREYNDAYMISGYYGYITGITWQTVEEEGKIKLIPINDGLDVWEGPFVEEKRLK